MSDKIIENTKQRNVKPAAPSKPVPDSMKQKKKIITTKPKKVESAVIEVSSIMRKNSRSVAAELINKNGNVSGPPEILIVPAALFTLRSPVRNDSCVEHNIEDDNQSIGSLASSLSLVQQSFNGSIIESCEAHEELLQTHYNSAKKRVIELSQSTNAPSAPFHLKIHTSATLKIYTAISSLLYATLSIARANDLDLFIRQNSVHLPQSMFDLNEWSAILNLARDHRNGNVAVNTGGTSTISTLTPSNQKGKILMNAAARIKNELHVVKKAVVAEMAEFNQVFASAAAQLKAQGCNTPPTEVNKNATELLKNEISRLNAAHMDELRVVNENHTVSMTKLKLEYAGDTDKLKRELERIQSTARTTSDHHTSIDAQVDDEARVDMAKAFSEMRTVYENEINELKATITRNEELMLCKVTDKDARISALEKELVDFKGAVALAKDTSACDVDALSKLSELNELVTSTQSECKQLQLKLQNEYDKNGLLSDKLVELQAIPQADPLEIERLHSENESLQRQVKDLEAHIEETSRPSDAIDDSSDPKELWLKEVENNKLLVFKLKQSQADLDAISKSKNAVSDQLSLLTKDYAAAQTQVQVTLNQFQVLTKEHESAQAQLQALINEHQVVQAQLQTLTKDHEAVQVQLQTLNQLKVSPNNDEALQNQVQTLTKDHESVQAQVRTLKQQNDSLSTNVKEMQKSLDGALAAKAALQEQYNKEMTTSQNQVVQIKELEKKLAGLGNGKGSSNDSQLISKLNKRIVELESERKSSKKPVTTQTSFPKLADYLPKHHGVAVRVQKIIRGFLGRAKVKKLLMKHVAGDRGILVACDGTNQGETGWYCEQDLYFYFCLDANGNYLLLCGPMTKEMYELVRSLTFYLCTYYHDTHSYIVL